MSGQLVLLTALSVAAVALAAVAAVTIWRLLKTLENLSVQGGRTLKEFEVLAEDIRETNTEVRKFVSRLEASAANVQHMTEGLRGFRSTLDAATSVLQFAVVPVLGNLAGGMAGARAAISHIVNRVFRKEEHHG